MVPFIFARILDFEPTIREIKVFKEEQELFGEIKDEAQSLNQQINDMRNAEFW